MSAFAENFIDYRASIAHVGIRSDAGDDSLEICGWCSCEVDVDPQPHKPDCPGIGKARATTVAVLPLLDSLRHSPAPRVDDGLVALERMDAGEPQQPERDDQDEPDDDEVLEEREPTAVTELAVSAAGIDLMPEPPSRSSSTARVTWDRDSIVAAIVRWNEAHGEPPRATAWTKAQDGYPSQSTVLNYFGKWLAAIEAAGFEPRQRGGQQRSTQNSSSERAGNPEPEEGPRSPTPDAGGLGDQQPPMGARTAEATDVAGEPEPRPAPNHDTTSQERESVSVGAGRSRSSDADTGHKLVARLLLIHANTLDAIGHDVLTSPRARLEDIAGGLRAIGEWLQLKDES